ncbi:hypothetical protein F5X99DRAFT_102901 [Biscogniauxia marginata]|nr:hypothetical protein F5X99DRAFT_102901 [Biscogniauxia marginata]
MLAREELMPCRFQHDIRLAWLPKRKVVDAMMWVVYTGVVIHILVGTLTLSGLLFISATDAVRIVERFVGGAIVCKWIFMSELDGIPKTTIFSDENEQKESASSPVLIAEEGSHMVLKNVDEP